ncbi:MAG TPA: YibE/F family protein [Candidatus Limnocylindria bacterium]|nr:YibE/F family protein [Candidatus Limnocylindria bacterium]
MSGSGRTPERRQGMGARLADGFRGNVVALVIGGLILVGLLLLPNLTPPPETPPPVDLAHGRIVAFLPDLDDPTLPDVVVEVLQGPLAGQIFEGYLQGPAGQQVLPDYFVGDEVVVSLSEGPEATYVAVSDRYRVPLFALVIGLFAVGVTLVGGWRGVRSLLALALTLAVVGKIVVPLLLAGWEPVLLAVAAGTAVTLVTILLTEGVRLTSLAAVAGTFAALLLTAGLAAAVNGLAGFTEYQGQEAAVFLQSMGRADLDISGLLLAAVIFGALGVLDDVTVTQAAAVNELAAAEPGATRMTLFMRAMNVGRSHIAATVNTLVLAYLGASLPLLVLFALGGADPLLVASGEIVAVEVIRAVVGSIGIVAAVPFTTAIAVMAVGSAPWRAASAELKRARMRGGPTGR